MIRALYLVRHGETDANAQGRAIGTSDPVLNERGESQAQRVAAALSTIDLGLVITSPRRRCRQTATAIAERQRVLPPVNADDRLVELGLGAFEGRSVEEIAAEGLEDVFAAWRQGTPPAYPPGAEYFEDVAVRLGEVFDDVVQSGVETVALVGHSHALRVLIATRILGCSPDLHRRLYLEHASVTSVFWEGATPRLAMLNGSAPRGAALPPVVASYAGN